MIVVDSSAVIAMMLEEPSAPVVADRLAADTERLMSVGNLHSGSAILMCDE